MAGDWIKVEGASAHKPEVAMLSNLLGVKRAEAFGLVVLFWTWFDQNATGDVVRMLSGSCPDTVQPMTAKSLDDVMQCPGFGAAMRAVGWVEIDEKAGTIRIPHADRHNGNTAKNRALDAKRKASSRAAGQNPDKGVTREEKRREEKKDLSQTPMSDSPSASSDVYPLQVDKGKPSKLRAEAADLLAFLNAKTGRHFRPTDTTLKPLMARLKEGFSVPECRAVVARKVREWGPDDKMRPFLRPDTLFGATKFAQYIGEVPPESEAASGT